MKTIQSLTLMLAGAMLAMTPLRAEEPTKEPAKGMKQEMSEKMKAMEAKMKSEAEEAEKLLAEMNASTGEKKIEAIAAILNKAAQKEKAMKAMCKKMMEDGKNDKDAKPGEPDGYFTCVMHPAIHWPIPAKCPICGMDLVPVEKKPSDAKPGAEPQKKEDPHAAHH